MITKLISAATAVMAFALLIAGNAWAQVPDLRITEVNYSPVGSDSQREHFEVTNFGAAAYTGDCTRSGSNLAADRFIEQVGGADRSHILCLQTNPAQFTIKAGETVIFARQKSRFISHFNPPGGCQVFDYGSSIALNNNGDIIRILDSFQGTELASMSYDGSIANNNGKSLQLDLVTETYFEALPTICSVEVSIDIKPQSCPNPLNVKSRGVLPVAILGTALFDVTLVDPATVRLVTVPPLRSTFEDVATPFDRTTAIGDCLDCTVLGSDGFLDLTLKFDTQAVVAALGDVTDGECLPLPLTGELVGGSGIVAEDVVVILKKGKK